MVNVELVGGTARKYLSGRPVVVIVGRPDWAARYLTGLSQVEIYDADGQRKSTPDKAGEAR